MGAEAMAQWDTVTLLEGCAPDIVEHHIAAVGRPHGLGVARGRLLGLPVQQLEHALAGAHRLNRHQSSCCADVDAHALTASLALLGH